ncbi:MAG: hypothetical protein ACYC3L_08800 [Gemmatimonadaceae bacterium]
MADNSVSFVVASYVITWVVIFGLLVRVLGAVRHARREYESVVKGAFNT